MQPTVTAWWEEHDNLLALAYWMADRMYTPKAIVYLFEKPWKHTDLWTEMKEEDDE